MLNKKLEKYFTLNNMNSQKAKDIEQELYSAALRKYRK